MFDELIAKLQFWKAKNFVMLDKHYEFMIDLSNKDAMTVRMLKKYPGVIIEYSNMHMSTENQMSYDISIVANPNLCKTESKVGTMTWDQVRTIAEDKMPDMNCFTIDSAMSMVSENTLFLSGCK